MDVFDLAATITLDSSGYMRGLSEASSHSSSFGSKLASGMTTAAKITAGALAACTTAAVGFAKSSIDAGKDFDSAMSQVAATMGITNEELNNTQVTTDNFTGTLRDFAQEMGSTTAFSATQAAEALNYMALAGYSANESVEMLPNVLNLAAAGNIDLARASDMVTDAQSALGLSAEQTVAMVDQMAAASSKSNTSVEQLGDAFLTIGATARTVKGGTEELSTVLGVLADNGIKGSEGGTHLRNMLLSLQNPTDAGRAALEQLGVAVYDTDGNMRSTIDIIADMQAGLNGMSQESKDAMLTGIFNKTDLAAANALLGTERERFDELTLAISDSAGAAERMAEVQLDNLEGDITLFKSALEGAQIAISDGLSPTVREFVQLSTDGISDVTRAFKEDGIDGAMAAFGTFLSDMINKVIETLPKAVEAGMKLLEALVKGILDNMPKITDAAFQIMMMIVDTLMNNLPQLITAALEIIVTLANGIADSLPELIPTMVQTIMTIVEALIDNVDKLVDSAIAITIALAEGLINALPILIEKAPIIVQKLVTAIVDNAPKLLDAAITLIMTLGQALIDDIPELLKSIPTIITSLVNGLVNVAPRLMEAALSFIETLVRGLINNLPKLVAQAPIIIGSIVKSLIENAFKLLEVGGKLIAQVGDGITKGFPKILFKIPGFLIDLVNTFVSNIGDGFSNVGHMIVNGLWNGIRDGWRWLLDSVDNLVDNLIDGVKDVLGIHSPSRVFAQIGEYCAEGLDEGISSAYGVFDNVYDTLSKSMKSSSDKLSSDASRSGFDAVGDGIASMLINGTSSSTNKYMVSEVIGSLTSVSDSLSKKVPSVFNTVGEAAYQGISVGLDKDAKSNLKNDILASMEPLISETSLHKKIVKMFHTIGDYMYLGIYEGLSFAIRGKSKSEFLYRSLSDDILFSISSDSGINSTKFHKKIVKMFQPIGDYMYLGIHEGFSSKYEKLSKDITKMISRIVNDVKDMLGIHSPSRVFSEIGEFCVAGFNEGLEGLVDTSALKKSISSSVNEISPSVRSVNTNSNGVQYNQTINVNQKISTPDELARAIKLESRYGLMRGVSLG